MSRSAAIEVAAPARLHLGFLDLNGNLGRRFGSLGLAIDAFPTIVRVAFSGHDQVVGTDAARVGKVIARLRQQLGFDSPLEVELVAAPPPHAGLGSGTQLALTLGTAVCRLHQRTVAPTELTTLLGRGLRSGIGLAAFQQGGFVVDAGAARQDRAPTTLVRIPFPDSWRVMLVLDPTGEGLHGAEEVAAFRALPPQARDAAGELCRLTLMGVLPGLVEQDLEQFGRAVTQIQAIVGDYFSPAQGGRFLSARVADALEWLAAEGVHCIGQSSWGPTGFAIVESGQAAERLVDAWQRRTRVPPIEWKICAGRNEGARISMRAAGRSVAALSSY
ncbi:MAG: beta-ribofuranosylaminobenzene 5'-phosphate synthase family protein [Burkholderiales bacterium]